MNIVDKMLEYKAKYKLIDKDLAYFLGVSEQSIRMWKKKYPMPSEENQAKLNEMFEILDSAKPKQRWLAFLCLGFGDDYEG